jgi:hypothetical protein
MFEIQFCFPPGVGNAHNCGGRQTENCSQVTGPVGESISSSGTNQSIYISQSLSPEEGNSINFWTLLQLHIRRRTKSIKPMELKVNSSESVTELK